MIGFYDKSKIWVSHGNKVLRCAPEQLRELSPDQIAAIEFLPVEAVKRDGKYALRGAQTFVDITNKDFPTEEQRGEVREIDDCEEGGNAKRRRVDEEDQDQEMEDGELGPNQSLGEGEINEESTKDDSEAARSKRTEDEDEMTARASETAPRSTYGPMRRQGQRTESTPLGTKAPENNLTQALRASTDLCEAAENTTGPGRSEEADDLLECHLTTTIEEVKTSGKYCKEHCETFLAQDRQGAEVREKDIVTEKMKMQNIQGKNKEFEKLIKTGAIVIHKGQQARDLRNTVPRERILGSRFVR